MHGGEDSGVAGGAARLDRATLTVIARPTIGEATLIFAVFLQGVVADALRLQRSGTRGFATDPLRSAHEAASRARREIRRWCVHNGASRMATLTYRGEGQFDWRLLWADIEGFRRALLAAGYPGAVLCVPEAHPGGHGWHVHCAVARYVPKAVLERCWSLGWVDVRKIRAATSRHNSGRDHARLCAAYVAGYVAKLAAIPVEDAEAVAGAANEGRVAPPALTRPFNGKRYSTTRGHTVPVERAFFRTTEEAHRWLTDLCGYSLRIAWSSHEKRDWLGPPLHCLEG